MGQAKVNKLIQRNALLQDLEKWSAPATEYEISLAKKISEFKSVTVTRAHPDDLKYMRMKPQECYANCVSYCRQDPENRCTTVTGWWDRDELYVLHSIIKRDEDYFCITPYPSEPDSLKFVFDENIILIDTPNGPQFHRDEKAVPHILRLNPDQMIAECIVIKNQLLSGGPIPNFAHIRSRKPFKLIILVKFKNCDFDTYYIIDFLYLNDVL